MRQTRPWVATMMPRYDKIRDFYNALQDEESRYIFIHRMNYLLTGRRDYLREMTENVNRLFHPAKQIRNISHLFSDNEQSKKRTILYGAGLESGLHLETCKKTGLNVIAFSDSNASKWDNEPEGRMHLGFPIISREELLSNQEYSGCNTNQQLTI